MQSHTPSAVDNENHVCMLPWDILWHLDGSVAPATPEQSKRADQKPPENETISPLNLDQSTSQQDSIKIQQTQQSTRKPPGAFPKSEDDSLKHSVDETESDGPKISRSYPTILQENSEERGYGKRKNSDSDKYSTQSSQHSWGHFFQIPPPLHPGYYPTGKRLGSSQVPHDLADRLQRAEREERLAEARRLQGDTTAKPDYTNIQKDRAKAFGAKNVEIPHVKEILARPPLNIGRRSTPFKISQTSMKDMRVNDNNRTSNGEEILISVQKDSDRGMPSTQSGSASIQSSQLAGVQPPSPESRTRRHHGHMRDDSPFPATPLRTNVSFEKDPISAKTSRSYTTVPQTVRSVPSESSNSFQTASTSTPQTASHPTTQQASSDTTPTLSSDIPATTSSGRTQPASSYTSQTTSSLAGQTLSPYLPPASTFAEPPFNSTKSFPRSPAPPNETASKSSTHTGRTLTGLHIHRRLLKKIRRFRKRRSERKQKKWNRQSQMLAYETQRKQHALSQKQQEGQEKLNARMRRERDSEQRRMAKLARTRRTLRRRRERAYSADEGRMEAGSEAGVERRDFALVERGRSRVREEPRGRI